MKNKTILYLGIFLIVFSISLYDDEKNYTQNYKSLISMVLGVLFIIIIYLKKDNV